MAEAKKAHAVGFNHVALEVGDIEEALAFYGRLLDCGSTRTASNGIDHIGRGIFSPARTCIARRCARTRTEISSRLLGGPLLPRTWDLVIDRLGESIHFFTALSRSGGGIDDLKVMGDRGRLGDHCRCRAIFLD